MKKFVVVALAVVVGVLASRAIQAGWELYWEGRDAARAEREHRLDVQRERIEAAARADIERRIGQLVEDRKKEGK